MLESLIDKLIVRKDYTSKEIGRLQNEFVSFLGKHPGETYPDIVFEKLRQPCTQMITDCSWKGKSFDCCQPNLTTLVHTNIGPCFVLLVSHFEDPYQYLAGPFDGIQFDISDVVSQKPTYTFNKLPVSGALISIADRFTPFVTQPQPAGFGTTTFIAMQRTRTRRIHNCIRSFSAGQLISNVTSYMACVYDCMVWDAYKTCGCIVPVFVSAERFKNISRCDPSVYATCFHDHVYPNLSETAVRCGSDRGKKSCLDACSLVDHHPTSGSTPLPPGYDRRIDTSSNQSFDYGKILIYFSTIGDQIILEVHTETWITLLSDIGGLIGLWLGLSIVGLGDHFIKFILFPVVKRLPCRRNVQLEINETQTH